LTLLRTAWAVWRSGITRHKPQHTSPRAIASRGDFNTIITLDTPEQGSELAAFLVNHRACTRAAPNQPNAFWIAACGGLPSTTVAQCFDHLGLPLSAPDRPIEEGAVYSLIPPDKQKQNALATLLGPNIQNANWLAVASVAPSNSSLTYLVNNFLLAIYSPFTPSTPGCAAGDKTPESVNKLLGSQNDAIVALDSQRPQAKHWYKFNNLSHSRFHIPWQVGLSDANVLDSLDVYTLVRCWLLTPGSSSCLSAPSATQAASPAPVASGSVTANVHYVDRLAIKAAPSLIELGTPFDLAVDIGENEIIDLQVVQRAETGGPAAPAATTSGIDGRNVYLKVMPLFYGETQFKVVATYSDGGISFKEFTGTVNLPSESPTEFHASFPISVLNLNHDNPSTRLAPWTIYASIPGLYDSVPGLDAKVPTRVYLDARYVSYSIAPAAGPSVVRLDPVNGIVYGLRPGLATIIGQFGTLTDKVFVSVHADADH
jgi:hypothetical protein